MRIEFNRELPRDGGKTRKKEPTSQYSLTISKIQAKFSFNYFQ